MPWCEWASDEDDGPCLASAEYQLLVFIPNGSRILQVWMVCKKHAGNSSNSCRLDEREEKEYAPPL